MGSLTIIFMLAIWIGLLVIVFRMAEKRGRSAGGWLLFSVLLSPIIGAIVLLCLGETEEYRRESIIRDEELRRSIRGNG